MTEESSALIQLGTVGAPFGVRGWVKLRSHTDPPERLLEHRRLSIGRGGDFTPYRIEASGRSGGALTVKFAGVEDRDQAQALRGADVCVARSELPQRNEKDFYRADLIGCEVVDLEGTGLGRVLHFIEAPAGVLMVVRGTREFWIPAVSRYLRRVDLEARRVVVDWSADGPALWSDPGSDAGGSDAGG
jgi:16S rRNA processing protein RimM